MKWHWGNSLFTALGLFSAGMLFMVYNSFDVNTELVSHDYYAKEVSYQSTIDKSNNLKKHTANFKYQINENGVLIQFQPLKISQGQITFVRPSNKSLDFALPVGTDDKGVQLVPVGLLTSGKWKLTIDWEQNGIGFYQEETIVLP